MITIVDYGVGNVRAFLNAYRRLNIEARTATTAQELLGARRLILPGVGSFDSTMTRLEESGMREELERTVLEAEVPILGVCVGMQLLGAGSEEGVKPGLGWIQGSVRALNRLSSAAELPKPHMGWNDVNPRDDNPLFRGLDEHWRFYFLHSYYFECANPEVIGATTTYGEEFVCSVRAGHIFGVQFHPEKSHRFGTTLLKNFATLKA